MPISEKREFISSEIDEEKLRLILMFDDMQIAEYPLENHARI